MSVIESSLVDVTSLSLDELRALTDCSIVLNGKRPEISVASVMELQRFKRFMRNALSDYSSDVQERILTHVWDRFSDPMEYRAFARYFFEGWLNANKINFTELVAYTSAGLPVEIIKHIVVKSNGRIQKVSDFGFGNISTLRPWQDLEMMVSAFDMIPFCVEAAHRNGIFSRVARIDGEYSSMEEAFELTSESQDLVTTTLTLDRVSKPKQLLKNMLATLRKGGYILVHTLLPIAAYDDGPNLNNRIEYTKPQDRITTGRGPESDRREIVELLTSFGVRDIQCQPFSYSVSCLDGSQSYIVCQFSGKKV